MNWPMFGAALIALLPVSPIWAAPQQFPLPTYAAAYEPSTVDERGMWQESDRAEKAIAHSALRIDDEALTGYIRQVLCKVVGDERCRGVRVYVLNVPAFNATMHPNGAMTIWSGLLLRVRSEAELGAVLGHEFAHFELRHSLKGFQVARSTTDALAWIQVLSAMTQQDTRNAQLSLIDTFFRFNRDQEKEADLLGLKYLANSPYPSRSASEIWQHIMEEADATALGRMVKKRHFYKAGFFASHPTDLDRADYLLQESLKFGDAGKDAGKRYFENLGKHLPDLLRSQAKLNDFAGTEYLLSGIASQTGWTGELLHARGEMFATRGNPRDLITATTLYLNAIDAGHKRPETLRGLGLSLIKSGQRTEGGRYLREYLDALPDAPDAKLIRMYIPANAGDQ